MKSIKNLILTVFLAIIVLINTAPNVQCESDLLSELLESNQNSNEKILSLLKEDLFTKNNRRRADLTTLMKLKREYSPLHWELCRNVNCTNIHSNGQVSKTWRMAQLAACCPSYRKQYSHHLKKNSF
ncbi:hypothetical protein BpHYR1_014406 [Brachionus plicatilis]|uniref:Uncharacterized protein n=1 Tax=Brachionus plicatilis TaxID=10195 RepID=A0A3M7QC36_BRAPC|nr:hypothetical protein BpHYR1_014406 [Brachionus plicatilis]